jgi:hypothetical protein
LNLRIAQITSILVAVGGLTGACYFQQIRYEAPPDVSPQDSDTRIAPIRLTVLVLAQPIAVTQDDSIDRRADWFPIELVVGDPRFAILFRDSDETTSKAALLDALPNRLIQRWGPGKHPRIEYRRYLNLAEYTADAAHAQSTAAGRLLIKLYNVESRTNASILAACLTLMLIPTFVDEAIHTESVFVGPDNRSHILSPRPGPFFRSWFGWVFCLWGPVAGVEADDFVIATVNARVREAGAAGIFVPASSRVDL